MMQLDEQTRERFTHELERDKRLPFDDDFRRTTDLERKILDQYGRAGAEFILRRNGLEPAHDDSCPWHIAHLDPVSAVRKVLGPLRDLLPQFIATLEERIRWVIPTRNKGVWMLAYVVDRALYDGRPYYGLITGGAPSAAPRLSERAEAIGWKLPLSYVILCEVHNGLGAIDGGILACEAAVDLGEMMEPIAAEQDFHPEGYAFQDLLEFFPDGSGNCQAFHRRSHEDADPPTVDWDHETRQISGEMPFFEFADEALQRQILDEE